jgi:hypothetical protein
MREALPDPFRLPEILPAEFTHLIFSRFHRAIRERIYRVISQRDSHRGRIEPAGIEPHQPENCGIFPGPFDPIIDSMHDFEGLSPKEEIR